MLSLIKTTLPQQCPVCREAFRDPRELPCGHTFCFPCVQEVERSARRTERPTHNVCPVCRAPLPEELQALPRGKVAALAGRGQSERPVLGVCVHHPEQILIGCCEPCRAVVCEQCLALPGAKHCGHQPVIDTDEFVARYPASTLLPLVAVLRRRLGPIDAAIATLEAMTSTLQARLFKLNNEITLAFHDAALLRPDVAAELEARRNELIEAARVGIDEDARSVMQQLRGLKISKDQAGTATRQVDSMVRTDYSHTHPYDEIRLYTLVFDRIKQVTPLEPDVNAWNRDTLRFRFPPDEAAVRATAPAQLGELYREGAPASVPAPASQ
eukprot:Unigene13024_Nuclearia_a/m.39503 Unigene13024_Nuclearia_a/g.39503  ORF Unigene13024_Nuclearia_a/g.39503 Unigene13024_Nuclearia_a/m.39503 type:complete len:326 (-) Unigene13024_Nuclearia_a:46-1023(-)